MLLLGSFLFLMPLATYLLILANVNRRETPAMASGTWDCVGMLLGVSGAIVGVGPMLLALLYQRGVIDPENPLPDFTTFWVRHALLWVFYYALALAMCVALIRWRRDKTSVYNVDFERLRHLFVRVVRERGLHVAALGNHVTLTRHPDETQVAVSATSRPPAYVGTPVVSELRIESFPAMRHVTIAWDNVEPGLREELELALRKRLADARADENPGANLLMAVSGLIMGALIMAIGFFITVQLLSRR